jgi:hypothetical protein
MELLMKFQKYLYLIIIFFTILVRAQDKSNINNDDTVVAKIGKDYYVTLKDLKKYISDWNYKNKFRTKSEIYKNALNDLIINQLKIFDFFDRKLNENHDLMKKISRNINNELIDIYYKKKFVDKYADERMAAEAYKEMDKEIICDDIILPLPSKITYEKLDSIKTIALKIENGLSKNFNIKEFIKRYSLKGVKLIDRENITWTESMINPVANVIFRLPKGSTKIIESMDGVHVVKVIDIKKIKLEPFEKMKGEIISTLQKGYYQVINNEYDNFRKGFIDKSSIKWNQSALDQIVKWSSEDARFYAGAYKDTIKKAISNGNNFEILTYNNGKVDLKEYLRLLEEVVILYPNTILVPGSVKDFILSAVYDDDVVKAAKRLGLEKELINPYTKDLVMQDRLVYLYNQAVIESRIPAPTPEALHKFYNEQKDSIFYQLKKVNIYARIYSDSAKAAADINEIRKGIPFEKVSDTWWNKAYIRERDGTLKSYRSPEPPYLAKASIKLKLNEVAGPIEYYDSTKGKQYAVIKCIYVQPEKQLTYDDVKGKRIEEEFIKFYRQKISDDVDTMLKNKYVVKIFENVLSDIILSK